MSPVGILHPGEMGAAVGAALVGAGETVLWASTGRSMATADRAAAAGLRDAGTVAKLVAACDLVLSVCPPHAAEKTAREAVASGLHGTYVDANAIAPASAAHVAEIVAAAGVTPVDGGIVGPPPYRAATTRLYLSGALAPAVAARFAGTPLEAVVLDGATSASALKMVYAAQSKGRVALLLATDAAARELGVADALAAENDRSRPDQAEALERARAAATAKGWRWVAEMEEIAATFAAAGEPDGFHRAAAEVFRRYERP
jgi:3-hydroxyisobutyrate dehydrogenase-like beta-hydroxyacid dehydrogenase